MQANEEADCSASFLCDKSKRYDYNEVISNVPKRPFYFKRKI